MDYLGYRLNWRQEEEEDKLPDIRILAHAMHWDLQKGGHPTLLSANTTFYNRNPFKDTQNPDISLEFQIRPMGCVHGHNTLADVGFTSLADVDINVPISPIFAKDLCGRVVHLGYGPDNKNLIEWANYNAQKVGENDEAINAHLAGVTFPNHCRLVDQRMGGHELLEEVFFCKFRTLDMSFYQERSPSGSADLLAAGIYANANLYPYKLRLDTYYTDGYKLPQTNMVYARQSVIASEYNASANYFMQAWQQRPQGQGYEEFITAQDTEKLFMEGCTVIPTFDACNGVNIVNKDFTLEDYWPGRAVKYLHEVVEERPNNAPIGTIIEVLEPGFVTPSKVQPAKVVISDGSGYVSPNDGDPAPLIPNLFLPHQRTVANWWATWLPTEPEHFEPPAIWGWEAATGRFMQLQGPIWDPLHYYYECTDTIINAFQSPMKENRWLVPVPENMFDRFYPIVPMQGFDTIDQEEAERRFSAEILPRSAVKKVHTNKQSAGVAYHPLPPQFEYELDPFWFPETHPLSRMVSNCPEELAERICPIISSIITPAHYIDTINAPDEATWITDRELMKKSGENPLEDYPFLVRYTEPDLPDEEIFTMSSGLFLDDIPEDYLTLPAQEIWPDIDDPENLEGLTFGLYDAIWDMRENALRLLRLRHDLYRKNPALYAYAWWVCVPANSVAQFFIDWLNQQELAARRNIPQKDKIPLGSQIMPTSPQNESSKFNPNEEIKLDGIDEER